MLKNLCLVSTDKAVKPVNVMGATKRLAELVCQGANTEYGTRFMSVRFGNVLGSSGSVIPIFQEQIRAGGPVTITDPDMERYFMSMPEAAQLILQAGSIGDGGEVFVLDMGEPIKILDIANELIRLSGFEPELDIPISFIGARPGEKKIEELIQDNEKVQKTKHEKIMHEVPVYMIANLVVEDADTYRKYEKGFFPILKKYEGSFITYDDNSETLEGSSPRSGRMIIFTFPSERKSQGMVY